MHKIIKAKVREPEAGFKLHYFPDISVDNASETFRKYRCSGCFQTETFTAATDGCGEKTPAPENRNVIAGKENSDTGNRDGFAKGFEVGRHEGIKAGQQQLAGVAAEFKARISDLERSRIELCRQAEKGAVELALAIGRKIVGQALTVDRDIVVHVVKSALARVLDTGRIKVKINPEDFAALTGADFDFSQFAESPDSFVFEAADSVSPGGCLIETEFGDIDARIEQQLAAIETELRQQLNTALSEA